MADTIFLAVKPDLKAVDNGDSTYLLSLASIPVVVGVDTVITGITPPLRAFDNGDSTYSLAIVLV